VNPFGVSVQSHALLEEVLLAAVDVLVQPGAAVVQLDF